MSNTVFTTIASLQLKIWHGKWFSMTMVWCDHRIDSKEYSGVAIAWCDLQINSRKIVVCSNNFRCNGIVKQHDKTGSRRAAITLKATSQSDSASTRKVFTEYSHISHHLAAFFQKCSTTSKFPPTHTSFCILWFLHENRKTFASTTSARTLGASVSLYTIFVPSEGLMNQSN